MQASWRYKIKGASQEDFLSSLAVVEDSFGAEWLTSGHSGHRLQKVWRRRDDISSIELYSLGYALRIMLEIDLRWTKAQVKLLKEGNPSNQGGALFEILGASYLAGDDRRAAPTPRNTPGFDVDVGSVDKRHWRVSLKNYSRSMHEHDFKSRVDAIREEFVREALAIRYPPSADIIFIAKKWPDQKNWSDLSNEIPAIIKKYASEGFCSFRDDIWEGCIQALPDRPGELRARTRFSHQVLGIAPFHRNERANFLAKLDHAIANARRYSRTGGDTLHAALIRVPPSVSASTFIDHAQQYIAQQGGLDVVILLQPFFGDVTGQGPSVAFHMRSARATAAIARNSELLLDVPIGIATDKAPIWNVQQADVIARLDGHYWHRRGEHYLLPVLQDDNHSSATMRRMEPGIVSRLLLEDAREAPALSGLWAHELCILGG